MDELVPFRDAEVSELCAVCREPTDGACERCALPLCPQHLPSDTVACPGCEAKCDECGRIVLLGRRCSRCLRPLCWRHRPLLRRWCARCQRDWRRSRDGRDNRTRKRAIGGIVASLTALFYVSTLGAGAGVFAALVGGMVPVVGLAAVYVRLASRSSRERFLREGQAAAELEAERAARLPVTSAAEPTDNSDGGD